MIFTRKKPLEEGLYWAIDTSIHPALQSPFVVHIEMQLGRTRVFSGDRSEIEPEESAWLAFGDEVDVPDVEMEEMAQ